jgi:asparagine N-glycosylation enzyme membrane subunit Stt3
VRTGEQPGLATRGYMLWTIFAILVILWLLGMVTSHVFGGFIHILLVLAIVAVLIRIIQGRSPL